MSFPGPAGRALLLALVVAGAAAPAIAQAERVPQSLWGVRADVGLGVIPQFVTNYGDRSFYEERPSGEDVRVAVIDTGLDPEHPDLDGSLACPHCWRDFVDNRTEPYDDNGHGTHVAGIIAGNGHLQANPLNSYFPTGAIGMASDADLVVAKAMNASGAGKDGRVAEAIRWALDPDGRPDSGDEPHIVHLSLGVRSDGGPSGSVPTGSKTEAAVETAVEQGTFVVMSAGNQGQQGPAVPGNVDGVVAVGALTSDGGVLEMSNRGEGVDVFAPGVVMSTWPQGLDRDRIEDGYTGLAGTSQAAPIVTGTLALAVDANSELKEPSATKVEHVETTIRQTGEARSTSGVALVAFDGGSFLASQDQGTSGLHWGMVTAVVLALLLVAVVLGRAGYTVLQEQADGDDVQPPGRESPDDTGETGDVAEEPGDVEFGEPSGSEAKP